MKLIHNFLDRNTIDMANTELATLLDSYNWGVSNNGWPGNLRGTIIGSVTTTPAGHELSTRVTEHIKSHLDVGNCKIVVQHYLWHPLSGINIHNDDFYVFGATIYLTPRWDINWGGLFAYTPDNNLKEMKIITPDYNSAVFNTRKLNHMVTTVSPLAPHPRYTLQIWGVQD